MFQKLCYVSLRFLSRLIPCYQHCDCIQTTHEPFILFLPSFISELLQFPHFACYFSSLTLSLRLECTKSHFSKVLVYLHTSAPDNFSEIVLGLVLFTASIFPGFEPDPLLIDYCFCQIVYF